MNCRLIVYITALLLGACGQPQPRATDDHPFQFSQMHQWKLPKALKEISGLALTQDERLFAIEDESANVFELDYDQGRLIKRFAVSDPVLRGDFEGIAKGSSGPSAASETSAPRVVAAGCVEDHSTPGKLFRWSSRRFSSVIRTRPAP